MKRCPECSRVYPDDTLNFCLEDGSWLAIDGRTEDAPTAVLSGDDLGNEDVTRQQVTITAAGDNAESTVRQYAAGSKYKSKIVTGIVVGAVALAALASGAWYYRSFGKGFKASFISLQSANFTRATSSGKVTGAAISPDGKYIAHTIDDGGQQSLWVSQTAASSNAQLVSPGQVGYVGLAFSPDGNYVYYTVLEADATGVLYQIPVLGGQSRKVLTGIRSAPSFSPDGKQIAFFRSGGLEDAVMIANADGSNPRQLALRTGDEQFFRGSFCTLAWSPDGNTIASPLRNFPENYTTVAGISVETGEVKRITQQRWFDVKQVTWLADGGGILTTAQQDANSGYKIWEISYPSGEAQKVTNDLSTYLSVSLTADNNAMATVQAERTSHLWVAPINDSSRGVQITNDRNFHSRVSWTPDGRLIYNSDATGTLDLYLADADGRNAKQLTANAGWNGDVSLTSDGRAIIFMSDRLGPPHIWRMNIDGSDQKQLTTEAYNVRPELSPDGQWIVYATSLKQGWYVWKMPAGGGQPVQLSEKLADYPTFSPDGKYVACYYWEENNSPTRIAILSVNGGPPIKVLMPTLPVGRETNLKWTADGKSIVYGVTLNGVANLWAQPISGENPKQITNFTSDRIIWFDISRDGKQLALSRGMTTNDVVLIKDFR
jgi:Tol biopolymer transport system component